MLTQGDLQSCTIRLGQYVQKITAYVIGEGGRPEACWHPALQHWRDPVQDWQRRKWWKSQSTHQWPPTSVRQRLDRKSRRRSDSLLVHLWLWLSPESVKWSYFGDTCAEEGESRLFPPPASHCNVSDRQRPGWQLCDNNLNCPLGHTCVRYHYKTVFILFWMRKWIYISCYFTNKCPSRWINTYFCSLSFFLPSSLSFLSLSGFFLAIGIIKIFTQIVSFRLYRILSGYFNSYASLDVDKNLLLLDNDYASFVLSISGDIYESKYYQQKRFSLFLSLSISLPLSLSLSLSLASFVLPV